jgi:hypothetical protein
MVRIAAIRRRGKVSGANRLFGWAYSPGPDARAADSAVAGTGRRPASRERVATTLTAKMAVIASTIVGPGAESSQKLA